MKKEALEIINRLILSEKGLEPLSVANFASERELNERSPNGNQTNK